MRYLGKSEREQVTARGIPASHSQPVPGRAQQQPALVGHGRGRNVLEKLGIYYFERAQSSKIAAGL